MKNTGKTKVQLVAELEALRQQVADLQAAASKRAHVNKMLRRSEEHYRTERKWAEEALHERQASFRAIFESAAIGIALVDRGGRPVESNPALQEMLGYSGEELRSMVFPDFTYPDDVTADLNLAKELLSGRRNHYQVEKRYVRKDGRLFWGRLTASLVRGPEGEPRFGIGMVEDITACKQAEEALRESEERLRTVVSNAPIVLWALDREGRFTFSEGRGPDGLGRKPGENVGKSVFDVYRDVPQILEENCRALAGETFTSTVEVAGLVFESRYVSLRDREGNISGAIGVATNITDRKRAEDALRQAEEKYRTLVDHIHDGVFIIQDSRIQFANEAFASMVGYTVAEVTGMDFRKLVAPEDEEMVADRYRHRQAGEEVPWSYEFCMLHRDQRTRIMVDMSVTVVTYQGRVASMGTVRDVTARKRAEAMLHESEQRYRTISEMISDYAYAVRLAPDYTYTVEWSTETFARVTGFILEKGPHSPSTWKMLIHPDDLPVARQRLQKLMSGQADVSEFRIITKSGEVRWVHESGRPVWDETQGRVTHLYIAGSDITDRKRVEEEKQRLQEQLFQARKLEALGTLAGGVAHDFNNILSAIMGFTELATDEVPEGTAARQNLQEVLKACRRAKRLVQQILTFSRPSQQQHEPIQLQPLVQEVLTFLRAAASETVQIRSQIDAATRPVAIGLSQWQQVLTNLCHNALQALEEKGGVLEVSLQQVAVECDLVCIQGNLKPGQYARLTVRDTGCGMAPDVVKRIFEPFFTTRPVGEGNGLGLAIVHGIVTGHGGGITVDSVPGRGTTFAVYLPVSECDAVSEDVTSSSIVSAERVSPKDAKGALSYATHFGH